MRIVKLQLTDFLSHWNTEIDFPQGLVLLTGVNEDVEASNSNGAGKSAIVDAISWGLYGKTVRNLSPADYVHKQAKADRCSVSITFDTGLTVTRFRGHQDFKNMVWCVYGADKTIQGTVVKGDEAVVTALGGMTYDSFTNSVFCGQGYAGDFVGGTDAKQKEILENILGITVFGQAQDITLGRIAEARKTLADLEDAGGVLDGNMQAQEMALEGIMARIEGLEEYQSRVTEDFNERKAEKRGQIARLKRAHANLKSRREKLRSELDALAPAPPATLSSAIEIQRERLERVREANAAVSERLRSERRRLGGVRKKIENVSWGVGLECGECGREIGEDCAKEYIARLDVELSGGEEALRALTGEGDSNRKMEAAIQDELNALLVREKRAREAQAEYDMDTLLLTGHARSIKDLSEELRNMVPAQTDFPKELSDLKAAQAKTEKVLAKLREDCDDLHGNVMVEEAYEAYLDFWKYGFGATGIRSYALDCILGSLTELANKYADILFSGSIHISFDTQRALRSGEFRDKFTIQVTNDYGAQTYKGNSGGEKRRVDLAVLLALQTLARRRSNVQIDFFVFDEVFGALDGAGCESVIKLLREITGDGTTVVISHNPELTPYFDNVIAIRKKNGRSEVI